MIYKAIFFDLFHTLVDVAAAPNAQGRYTADLLGLDRRAWSEACFGPLHEICKPTDHGDVVRTLAHSLDADIGEERIRAATQERQRRFDHALEQVDTEVLEVLDEVRGRGARLGLISNASTGEVAAWARSPLAARFEQVLFSCECGIRKPDPAIYRLALSRFQLAPGQALFVGDGGSDEHRGAREVGLDNVLITRHLGGLDPKALAERRATVRWEIGRLGELLPLLESGPNE